MLSFLHDSLSWLATNREAVPELYDPPTKSAFGIGAAHSVMCSCGPCCALAEATLKSLRPCPAVGFQCPCWLAAGLGLGVRGSGLGSQGLGCQSLSASCLAVVGVAVCLTACPAPDDAAAAHCTPCPARQTAILLFKDAPGQTRASCKHWSVHCSPSQAPGQQTGPHVPRCDPRTRMNPATPTPCLYRLPFPPRPTKKNRKMPQQAWWLRRGRGYSVNVPLRQGIGDAAYAQIFKPIMDKVAHAEVLLSGRLAFLKFRV